MLDGLLASGISSASLHVLSRNPNGKGAQALATRGVHVVSGDLDDEASVREAMKGTCGLTQPGDRPVRSAIYSITSSPVLDSNKNAFSVSGNRGVHVMFIDSDDQAFPLKTIIGPIPTIL